MKTFAAPVAVIALLLSVMPAMAEDAPVKVDPKKIEKLTPENAPKPSLSDKLLSAVRGDAPTGKFIDPTKAKPPEPVTAPAIKGHPAPEMLPTNVAPKPMNAVEAPKVDLPPAPVAAKPAKLNDKKISEIQFESKPAQDVKADEAKTKDAVKKIVEPEKTPVTAEEAMAKAKAEEKQAEKTGISKYLPW